MEAIVEDIFGKKWAGVLTPVENAIREGTPPAVLTGKPQRIGNSLYPDATEASLSNAIDESWRYYREQYENFNLSSIGNVPDEAHARSQGAKALAIELPAGEIRITQQLYWPAMIPMRSNSLFNGATLRFMFGAQLNVLGIMQTDWGEVSPFGGGFSGVQFVKSSAAVGPIHLLGTFQDFRMRDIHTVTSGNDGLIDIHHRRASQVIQTPYGSVDGSNPHIKELEICGTCQFESRSKESTSIRLISPKRSTINGAHFLYSDLGIAATEADEFVVTNCKFSGNRKDKPCRVPMIIESSHRGHVSVSNNFFRHVEKGAQLYMTGGSKLRQVADANNFWNGGLHSGAVDYYERGTQVVHGAGVFKTGDAL